MRRVVLPVLLLGVIFNAGHSVAHDVPGSTRSYTASTPAPEVARSLDGQTRRLLDLNARHQRATDASGKSSALRDLLAVAAQRQQLLGALIESDPGAVISSAVSASVRAALPPAALQYMEEDVTLEGELDVLHEDSASGDRYLHWLKLGGSRLSLHFAVAPPAFQSGDRVRLRGLRVQQALALADGNSQVTVLAAAVPNTFGAQKTAVFLVSFQSQPGVTSASPSQAQDVVFDASSSVSNFFLEASYQQTWLTGGVFGPYAIAVSTSSCDYYGIASAAEQAATAAGINLSTYTRRVYAFSALGACPWWGLGTVGGSPSKAWINGSFQNGVVSHEMGHNLGLYHSHALECGSLTMAAGCTNVEYGDMLDVMGSATPPKHFNAAQKDRLGWLNYGASPPITTVQSTGVYTIDPYEPPGSNPKALKFRTSAGDWYYIEYRQPFGFDSSTVSSNTNVRNGVVVHWVDGGAASGVYLLDMTPATSSWSDPALDLSQSYSDSSAGLTIAPLWVNATNAGVSITVGTSSCVRQNPTVAVAPAQQQGAPGVAVTYTVSVTNNDTGCGSSTFTQQAAIPAGWAGTFGSTALTVAGAATVSTTLSVTPPTSVSAGNYAIAPTAQNAAVPSYAASGTAMYAIASTPGAGTFTDDFNRPDSADVGGGWTEVKGDLMIQGGRLRNAAARTLHTAVVPGVVGATEHASVTFTVASTNGGPRFGLIVRSNGPGDYYACYRQTGGSSAFRIVRVVNGAERILKASSIKNPAAGEAFGIGCRAEGSTITLEFDGGDRISASDSTFSTGSVGLFIGYATRAGKRSSSHSADDFSATAQ